MVQIIDHERPHIVGLLVPTDIFGRLFGEPITLHLSLSRKDLAHYLGTRRESLSRAVHALAEKAILRIINPEIFEVLDLQALTDMSGDDLTLDLE